MMWMMLIFLNSLVLVCWFVLVCLCYSFPHWNHRFRIAYVISIYFLSVHFFLASTDCNHISLCRAFWSSLEFTSDSGSVWIIIFILIYSNSIQNFVTSFKNLNFCWMQESFNKTNKQFIHNVFCLFQSFSILNLKIVWMFNTLKSQCHWIR